MRRNRGRRLEAAELMDGLYLAQAALALHELGVISSMESPVTPESIASQHQLNPSILRGTLDYLAERTNLIRKTACGYERTDHYAKDIRFLFDLYGGAYAGNVSSLARVLKNPNLASRLVNRTKHAEAFSNAGGAGNAWITSFLRELKWNHVLDIGCGPAAMLIQLAAADDRFACWGLESNEAMCASARRFIREAHLTRRIRIWHGDLKRIEASIPASTLASVEALTACQVVNELFANESTRAVAWLKKLRRIFPGRPLLIADYYGRLGSTHKSGRHPVVLLHDYAQLISGQGLPPPGLKEWAQIYSEAGCRLVHVTEDSSSTRFLHVVVL